MKYKSIEIYNYSDYRHYLKDVFKIKKIANPHFSYNLWAKKLGLKNNTSLLKIINGQRNAGEEITERLCQDLELNDSRKEYFSGMIRLEKVKDDPELRSLLSTKLRSINRKQAFKLIDVVELNAISHWSSYAIRQLTKLQEMPNNPKLIKSKFIFKISINDIKKTVEELLILNLLEEKNGVLKRVENRINTSDDVWSLGLRRFHLQALELAKKALINVEPSLREISSLTIACKKEDIVKAKIRIREFQDAFDAEFACEKPDVVYQMQTQFFPLTKE